MAFLAHNRRLVAEIERLEHKSRRPDVLVDEELIHAFYDAKLPPEVLDIASFEAWRRAPRSSRPSAAAVRAIQLMRHDAEGITTDRFPSSLEVLGQKLKLTYLRARRGRRR
jgi:ATP-dependent helicase HrpA